MIIAGMDFPGFVPKFGDERHIRATRQIEELASVVEKHEARRKRDPIGARRGDAKVAEARDKIRSIIAQLI